MFFFFLNAPAPTNISPLPQHAALPIKKMPPHMNFSGNRHIGREYVSGQSGTARPARLLVTLAPARISRNVAAASRRSEEHTSELQSQSNLVCRLLLEKKKKPPHIHLDT